MRKLIIAAFFVLATTVGFAQPVLDLGFKAGVHMSNMDVGGSFDVNSDAITQLHFGAFGRVGFGRLFVQPEAYFSKKGGDLSLSIVDQVVEGGFDYKNIDVPVLLGFKVVKSKLIDVHAIAGPVFSFVTDAEYPDELDAVLKEEFFNDHLFGIQYGVGVDVLFLTIDARMEHAGKIYDGVSNFGKLNGKGNTFMLSVGFKIL